MKRNIILLYIFISFLSACKKQVVEQCKDKSFFITNYYDGIGHTKGEMLFIFNICDSLIKMDTIPMNSYRYAHHDIKKSYLSFIIPSDYKLNSIERITNFNASIWSEYDQNISQYLKLNGINYSSNRKIPFYNPKKFNRNINNDSPDSSQEELDEIEINYDIFMGTDNLIYYPDLSINDFIRNKFKNIEQKDLINAVTKEFINPENIANQENFKNEKLIWFSLTKKYKKGDFTNNNDIFKVDFHEVLIKLKLIKDGKSVEKILKYNIHVGN